MCLKLLNLGLSALKISAEAAECGRRFGSNSKIISIICFDDFYESKLASCSRFGGLVDLLVHNSLQAGPRNYSFKKIDLLNFCTVLQKRENNRWIHYLYAKVLL